MKKYDIAAYIWPAYTGDEERTRIFWPEGIGEWQTVKNAHEVLPYKPAGYVWDRKPLWGYVNEADPYVMEMEIEAALDHDANSLWDRRTSDSPVTIWESKPNAEQFQVIGKRWIEKYFKLPCYYCIDGKPVVSIYDVASFIQGVGGVEQAIESLEWLRAEAVRQGLPGVHIQMIKCGYNQMNVSGVDSSSMTLSIMEVLELLKFDSCTHYQYVHFTDVKRDCSEILPDVLKEWEETRQKSPVEYFPHVSVSWDNNPRHFRNQPSGRFQLL